MAEYKLSALIRGLTPWFFNKKNNNTIEGHTYPITGHSLDIGSSTAPFRNVYADNLVGTDGSSLDRFVRVNSSDSISGYLDDKLTTDSPISKTISSGVIHIGVDSTGFLLADGSVPLAGNWSINTGVTIDGVDLGTVGNGLTISSNHYAVNLATNPGLEFSSSALRVKVASPSGLSLGAGGLTANLSNGLEFSSNNIRVNQAFDFSWTGDHTFSTGTVRFNTDPQINANLNFIKSTTVSLTARHTLNIMPGYDNDETTVIDGSAALYLKPTGNIVMDNTQTFRSTTINDLPTGIDGIDIFNRYDNYVQMTVGAIKADELYVRVFVADETRVDRGAEMWSKSFGIVQEDFSIPAINSTVDVWFESAPEVAGDSLFSNGDYMQLRTIDWGTGIIIQKIWWKITAARLAIETTVDGVERQKWRIKRLAGGWTTTGTDKVKRGSLMIDHGQVGAGTISLSALTTTTGGTGGPTVGGGDNGPFLQISEMTSVGTVPQFTNYVQLGNLNQVAGYSSNTWGIAAGNDLGLDPALGLFSGFALEATNGLRLWNTDINMYDGSTKVLALTRDNGLNMRIDSSSFANEYSVIGWFEDVDIPSSSGPRTMITSYTNGSGGAESVFFTGSHDASDVAHILVQAISGDGPGSGHSSSIDMYASVGIDPSFDRISIGSNRIELVGNYIAAFDLFNVFSNSSAVNETTGLLIEQNSTGDAVLHWRLTSPNKYFTSGIDNSDGDKWKLSIGTTLGTNDMIVVDPATGTVTINGFTPGTGSTGLAAGDGISLSGITVSVDASVVRTSRVINPGSGLSGGGDLSADRTLSVDGTVVRTSRLISTAGALDGASDLSTDVFLSLTLASGSGLTQAGNALAISSTFAGAGLTLTTGVLNVVSSTNGIDVNANDIALVLATSSGLNQTSGLTIDSSVAGTGLTWTTGVLDVIALSTGGLTANANNLQIKLASPSGLITDATGLYIGDGIAGDGLQITAKVLSVDASVVRTTLLLTAGNGLTGGGDLSANRSFDVGAGLGITVNTNDVAIHLATTSGLNLTSGLALDDSVAGDGLSIGSKVLAVGQGAGILVNPNDIQILLGSNSALNTTLGLVVDTSIAGAGLTMTTGVINVIALSTGGLTANTNDIQIKLPTHSGLFTDASGLYVDSSIAGDGLGWDGTNKILSVNVSNGLEINTDNVRVNQAFGFSWTGNSTWAGTSGFSGNVTLTGNGTFSTGVFTFNTTPQINADLNFTKSSATTITSAQALTITTTTGDLTLDPTGIIILPNAQEMKTSTFTDAVTGIVGMRFWDRGSNYRQLTIGAMKMDELYARAFTADQVRIERGEEFWSKSYGVVETDFVLPAINSTVNVWFEDAPGLGALPIFTANDYLLVTTIDWTTSMSIVRVWFQVQDGDGAGTNDWISHDGTNYRQQWTIKRTSGGTTSQVIKKGITAVDTGQTGQGQIYLSALKQDGGPFIEIGAQTSVSSGVPQFTYYTRMGNLNGTVDYVTDTYGFVAGKNIGTSVSSGFSGATVDATNGLRLFNTAFYLYASGTKIGSFGEDTGVVYAYGSGVYGSAQRGMYWTSGSLPTLTNSSSLSAYRDVNGNHISLFSSNAGAVDMQIYAQNSSNSHSTYLNVTPDNFFVFHYGDVQLQSSHGGRYSFGVTPSTTPTSFVHIQENTTTNDVNTGLTIQNSNSGSGDAMLHFKTSSTDKHTTIGSDISDTDAFFKIANGTDYTNVRVLIEQNVSGNSNYGAFRTFSAVAKATVQDTDVATFGSSEATASQLQLRVITSGSATSASRSMGIQSTEQGAGSRGLSINSSGGNVSIGNSSTQTTVSGQLGINIVPISIAHVFESSVNTGTTAGFTIEQGSSGDAIAQFLLTSTRRWVVGIDNSDGDAFKISNNAALGSGDVIIATTTNLVGVGVSPISLLHIKESNGNTGSTIGLTIEQASTGDAVAQFLMTAGTRWVIGIDNSDSDKFKINNGALGSADLLTIDTSGNFGFNQSAPSWQTHITGTASGAKLTALALHNNTNTNSSEVAIRFVARNTTITVDSNRVGEIALNSGAGPSTLFARVADGTNLVTAWSATSATFSVPNNAVVSGALGVTGLSTLSSGLTFGGTTLSNYDEGTWTPGIAFGGNAVGVTYTSHTASYIRVGNIVFYNFGIVLSNKGSSTGNVTITGLPINPTKAVNSAVVQWANMNSSFLDITMVSRASSSVIDVYGIAAAGASNVTTVTNAGIASNTQLFGSGYYFVN